MPNFGIKYILNTFFQSTRQHVLYDGQAVVVQPNKGHQLSSSRGPVHSCQEGTII